MRKRRASVAAPLVGASRDACLAHFGHFLRHRSHRKDAFDGVLDRWVDNFLRPEICKAASTGTSPRMRADWR
jgi:hypothetical protein